MKQDVALSDEQNTGDLINRLASDYTALQKTLTLFG